MLLCRRALTSAAILMLLGALVGCAPKQATMPQNAPAMAPAPEDVPVSEPAAQPAVADTQGDVDISELGLELYPGAELHNKSNIGMGEGTFISATLVTEDGFDTVIAFYKTKYPDAGGDVRGPGKVFQMQVSPEPDLRSLQIRRSDATHVAVTLVRHKQ